MGYRLLSYGPLRGANSMGVMYFKRYRMEIRLHPGLLTALDLPVGYRLLAWHPDLLPAHAETKCRSFVTEIDANVFPCLVEMAGCHRLMHDISMKGCFQPGATGLAARFISDDVRSVIPRAAT